MNINADHSLRNRSLYNRITKMRNMGCKQAYTCPQTSFRRQNSSTHFTVTTCDKQCMAIYSLMCKPASLRYHCCHISMLQKMPVRCKPCHSLRVQPNIHHFPYADIRFIFGKQKTKLGKLKG